MGLVMLFLIITGKELNQLGIYLAYNGMLISLVTSGHSLILGGRYRLEQLISHEIVVFSLGVLGIVFVFDFIEAISLIVYFTGGLIFAHGSLILKMEGETRKLYHYLCISIALKALVIISFKSNLYFVLVLMGITDIVYIKWVKPTRYFLSFSFAVVMIAAGGFLNQFGNLQIRQLFENIVNFEWILRLVEMPAMLFWTLILYGWKSGLNYYGASSILYRIVITGSLVLLHVVLKEFSSIDISVKFSALIISFNLLKMELSMFSLRYLLSGRTIVVLGLEMLYLIIVYVIVYNNIGIQGFLCLLNVYAVIAISLFLLLVKPMDG
jgi:hypothetical protein